MIFLNMLIQLFYIIREVKIKIHITVMNTFFSLQ